MAISVRTRSGAPMARTSGSSPIASSGAKKTRVCNALRSPRAKIVTLSCGAYVSPAGPVNDPGTIVSIS